MNGVKVKSVDLVDDLATIESVLDAMDWVSAGSIAGADADEAEAREAFTRVKIAIIAAEFANDKLDKDALATPPDAQQARLLERVAELEREKAGNERAMSIIDRAAVILERDILGPEAAEARLAQAEREPHEFRPDAPGIVGSDLCTVCGLEYSDHAQAERATAVTEADEQYLQEVADGAWGDDPRTRGLARERLAALAEPQQAVTEARTLLVCPMRDAVCPHGLGCPYSRGYDCDMEASRAALRTSSTGGKG